jgi:hypothetical protein
MLRVLTDRDAREGFWCYRPGEGFPPIAIRDPEDYDAGPSASIACTQTGLPPREQARLVRHWCKVLPTLTELEFLWFHSKVPQELFDAACRVPHLQGLWIKWSSIKSIEAVSRCANLRFLHLGSSSQIESIEHLRGLQSLVWLELQNIKRLSDLTVIGDLQQLHGLAIEGSVWTTQVVDSLAPLAKLRSLRYLSLVNLKARDKTLRPLFSLSSLEGFHAAQWWSEEEVSQLRSANPKLSGRAQ